LGLEIERVLAIDPAPELKVRVRTRIDHERASDSSWRNWWLVSAGALGVVVLVALLLNRPEPLPAPLMSRDQANAMIELPPDVLPEPFESRPAPVAVGRQSNPSIQPVPELAALRRIVVDIREGRIDPSVLEPPPAAPLEPVAEIAIESITIAPLARLEPLLEGEPQ
jgi:hypothetical protein